MTFAASQRIIRIPRPVTRHAYWLTVLLPLLLPAAWMLREVPGLETVFAWLPLLFLFGVLPVADTLLGRDPSRPEDAAKGSPGVYPAVLVPVAAAGVYLAVLAWSVAVVGGAGHSWSAGALLGWTLSLGDIGGVIAINIAHELIHRRARWQQRLGGVLLSCVCYAGFKLEHPQRHHVNVATPADPSSAPRGSTVYTRVPRALLLNTVHAWQLAHRGAVAKGRRWPWLQHELTGWWTLSGALLAASIWVAGATGAAVFIGQALAAAALLEIINYIEHYGLRREKVAAGRYEPPSVRHSWNGDFWLSNVLLLQLQRHPDHHVHPTRPFTRLESVRDAPQLPLGYAALSLIALVPPLWRRLIHPRLPAS